MKKLLGFLIVFTLIFTNALACSYGCGVIGPFDEPQTEQELQIEALQRINANPNAFDGKRAQVVHVGNVREQPSRFARKVGSAYIDQVYQILDYQIVSNGVWLEVPFGYGTAWISASLVKISGGGVVIDVAPYYIGLTCRITVSSGRARMGAGIDYPIIEYVGCGEQYTILDTAVAADNTVWFKIMKDNNYCWISSGIASVP